MRKKEMNEEEKKDYLDSVKHIDIKIKKPSQLFNSFDPSPFIEKDLDDDAIEFIMSYIREFGLGVDSNIRIHFPHHMKNKFSEKDVKKAIHRFFSYKKDIAQKNVHVQIIEGQKSLGVGILFLISCLFIREFFFSHNMTVAGIIIREGLMIGGWVGMWNPISNILYDWWPMYREKKVYEKISEMKIEFIYGKKPKKR
jgi:hypothetical protein